MTWWDPRHLILGAESSFGLRRDDLIVKDGDMFAVERRLADYQMWAGARASAIEQGARPTVRIQTATAWAAEQAALGIDQAVLDLPPGEGHAAAGPIDIVQIPGAENRPRGPRFGTLVHMVLATVALDAAPGAVATVTGTQARIINASAEETAAAAIVVSAVLAHDLISRVRASRSVARETPVSWVRKDGTLIEGVLDLAFEEGARTVVVDFKTDHELSAGETRYRAQLHQYLSAVARATGRETAGVLFRV